jgi:hypothetical protein
VCLLSGMSRIFTYNQGKVKVKFSLEEFLKAQRGYSSSSTPSFTSALYGDRSLRPRPGRFTLGKETRYRLYRRLNGPQVLSRRLRKISLCKNFLFSCALFVIEPYLYLFCPNCPAFCLLVFTFNTQHKHPRPRRDSKPQPQQAFGPRPSPLTAQPLASAGFDFRIVQPPVSDIKPTTQPPVSDTKPTTQPPVSDNKPRTLPPVSDTKPRTQPPVSDTKPRAQPHNQTGLMQGTDRTLSREKNRCLSRQWNSILDWQPVLKSRHSQS